MIHRASINLWAGDYAKYRALSAVHELTKTQRLTGVYKYLSSLRSVVESSLNSSRLVVISFARRS